MNEKKSVLKEKSFSFAMECVKVYKILNEVNKEYVLNKQLLRSGTSIGANIRETLNGESKADFVHKLSIAQKECDETLYWIELLNKSGFVKDCDYESLEKQATEMLTMLKSSILTCKSHNP